MKTDIAIIERETENTLEIRVHAAAWKMPMLIGKCYKRIAEHLQALKAEPSGAPFVRYTEIDWQGVNCKNKLVSFIRMFTYTWKMLVGFPVKAGMQGSGDLKTGTIPKGRYLKAVHCGPYQKVGDTYNALLAFAKEKNLSLKNETIEFYGNDPRTTKPEDLRTEILIPIAE